MHAEEIARLEALRRPLPKEQAARIRVETVVRAQTFVAVDESGPEAFAEPGACLAAIYQCPGCDGYVPLEVLDDRDSGLCPACDARLRSLKRHQVSATPELLLQSV